MRLLGLMLSLCLISGTTGLSAEPENSFEKLNRGTFCDGHEDAYLRALRRARLHYGLYPGCPLDPVGHFVGNPYDRGYRLGVEDARSLLRRFGRGT